MAHFLRKGGCGFLRKGGGGEASSAGGGGGGAEWLLRKVGRVLKNPVKVPQEFDTLQ